MEHNISCIKNLAAKRLGRGRITIVVEDLVLLGRQPHAWSDLI